MVDKLYHRANLRSSFRPNVRFVVKIQRFVCDRATPPIIEILQSKGVATLDCNDVRKFRAPRTVVRECCYVQTYSLVFNHRGSPNTPSSIKFNPFRMKFHALALALTPDTHS